MKRLLLSLLLCLSLCGPAFAQTPATDMNRGLALVPTAQATSKAIKSGNWSNPATWDVPPATDGFVWIPPNTCIVQDIDTPRLKKLFVQGCLSPLDDTDVELNCETIVGDMDSRFWAGTKTAGFAGQWRINLLDYGPIDTVADPFVLSRCFMPMGTVQIYGAPIDEVCFTTGNRIGDTIVTLTAPATGWKAADKLVLPGVGFRTVKTATASSLFDDDDQCQIKAISTDGLTLTLTAPLKFDHGPTDREGFPRQTLAMNLSPAHIHIQSENPALDRRAHVMLMRGDLTTVQDLAYVTVQDCGRTDKSILVTDPDGKGNGQGDPRGRYALHFHRCGPLLTGVPATALGCRVIGSPGWGFVNHDSQVLLRHCASYGVRGAGFVGEIGSETGDFSDCVSIRNTSSRFSAPNQDGDNGGNSDFAKFGHGYWLQGPGITMHRCIATGCQGSAVVIMTFVPFLSNGAPVLFDARNLPAGMSYSKPTLSPAIVPALLDGISVYGSSVGFSLWVSINKQLHPPIGRNKFSHFTVESDLNVIHDGYTSNADISDVRGVRIAGDYTSGQAFAHGGGNTDISIQRFESYGYAFAMMCPTCGDVFVADCKFRALTGILVNNLTGEIQTRMDLNRNTLLPLTAAELASVRSRLSGTGGQFSFPFLTLQGKNPALYVFALTYSPFSVYDRGPSMTTFAGYAPVDRHNAICAMQNNYFEVVKQSRNIDGRPAHFREQDPSFKLSACPSLPSKFLGLTTGELWNQFAMTFVARVAPADAVRLAGSEVLVSDSPAVQLPDLQVTQWSKGTGFNYQTANKAAGYVAKCKDSKGQYVYSQPTDLTDRDWTVVFVQADGIRRGVLVWCDSSLTNPLVSW